MTESNHLMQYKEQSAYCQG